MLLAGEREREKKKKIFKHIFDRSRKYKSLVFGFKKLKDYHFIESVWNCFEIVSEAQNFDSLMLFLKIAKFQHLQLDIF